MTTSQQTRMFHTVFCVSSLEEALEHLVKPGEIFVVVRGRPRWLRLRCPCGCGDLVTLNLDPRTGRSWKLSMKDDKVTVLPSVRRTSGCKSHFLLLSNRVTFA